jgi:hypothetical protein
MRKGQHTGFGIGEPVRREEDLRLVQRQGNSAAFSGEFCVKRKFPRHNPRLGSSAGAGRTLQWSYRRGRNEIKRAGHGADHRNVHSPGVGIMQSQSRNLRTYALAGTAFAVLLGLSAPSINAQSAPFAGMAGSWAGSGRIDLQDGTSERIRCRASYSVGGDGLSFQQQLRCASDSYKFDVNSNVQSHGGSLSGTWSKPPAT